MTVELDKEYGDVYPYENAARKAYSIVLEIGYPTEIRCAAVGATLGGSVRFDASTALWSLTQEFGDHLPKVLAASLRLYWYAVYKTAFTLDMRRTVDRPLGQPASLFAQCSSNIELPKRPHVVSLELAVAPSLQDENLERLARSVGLDECPALENVLEAVGFLFLNVAEACLKEHISKNGSDIPYEVMSKITDLAFRAKDALWEAHSVRIWDARSDGEDEHEKLRLLRKEQARAGGLARLKNDPRQQEKALVYECWQAWQEKPENYPSQAAFARDMLTKCEHLLTARAIEDWCREWGRARRSS